jgi:hypothetical protein
VIGVAAAFVLGLVLTFAGGGSDSSARGRTVAAPSAKPTPKATQPPRRPTTRPPSPSAAPRPTRDPDWDGRESDFGFVTQVGRRAPEGVRVQFDRAEVRSGRIINRSSRVRELLIAPNAVIFGRDALAQTDTPRRLTLDAFVVAMSSAAFAGDPVPLRLRYDSYGRVFRIDER